MSAVHHHSGGPSVLGDGLAVSPDPVSAILSELRGIPPDSKARVALQTLHLLDHRLRANLPDSAPFRSAVSSSLDVVAAHGDILTLDDPPVNFRNRVLWFELEHQLAGLESHSEVGLERFTNEIRKQFGQPIHYRSGRHQAAQSSETPLRYPREKKDYLTLPPHPTSPSLVNCSLTSPLPTWRMPADSATVASAVRIVGAEVEIIKTTLRSGDWITQATTLQNAYDILTSRLQSDLIFFPGRTTPQLAPAIETLLRLSEERFIRSDFDRPEDFQYASLDLCNRLDSAYDNLCRTAFWSERPADIGIVEYASNITGVPPAILDAITEVEQGLVVDPSASGPRNGFAYAPDQRELAAVLAHAGARLVVLSEHTNTVGFYITHSDPDFLPAKALEVVRIALSRGLASPGARTAWCEIVGLGIAARDSFRAQGINGYDILDGAVAATMAVEQIDVAFALVRASNLALNAHLRRNWEDTGLVIKMGAHNSIEYKILRRIFSTTAGAATVVPPPACAQHTTPPNPRERIRPDFGDRTPYDHRPLTTANDALRCAPYMDDLQALRVCSTWAKRHHPSSTTSPSQCSDGLVLTIEGGHERYVVRQIQPRKDIWAVDSFNDEPRGTLVEVLNFHINQKRKRYWE